LLGTRSYNHFVLRKY